MDVPSAADFSPDYCERVGGSYIGCDNDPLSLEARRELCTNQNGGLLFGGIQVVSIANPCGPVACYVIPDSNFGTVKSVAEYVIANRIEIETIKIVPYSWKIISEILWEASYSNVTITNFPATWERLSNDPDVVVNGLRNIAGENTIVDAFCGGSLGDTVIEAIIAAVGSMIVNDTITMLATTSGSRNITFAAADIFPVLTEVGTKLILDGVELTSAVASPVTFRPGGDRCTVFDVDARDTTFRNIVFNLSECAGTGIDATPIVYSGTTARGALVENITVVDGTGAAVAFVGRDTGAFLYSPEIGVSGATVRDVIHAEGEFIIAAFAAAVESASVGTIAVETCPYWLLVGTTVNAGPFGQLTLEDGKLMSVSGRCIGITDGVIDLVENPNCSLWWGLDGSGVHPWGAPVLCPREFNGTVMAVFCEACGIGSQALVVDDRPRVRQWDGGVTVTAAGLCVNVNGREEPCDPAALYGETSRGVCNTAQGLDRFACAKSMAGLKTVVDPPGCESVVSGTPSCSDPLFGLGGSSTVLVECDCGNYFGGITCDPTIDDGLCDRFYTTSEIAAAVNRSCADRCETCTGVTVGSAAAVIVEGVAEGRGGLLSCDGAILERGFGWTDREAIVGSGVARVETVVVQPARFAVFDLNLGNVGILNVTEFTADFGDAYEIEVRGKDHTNDGSAAVVAILTSTIALAELILLLALNYVD